MNPGAVTTPAEAGFHARLDACYRTDGGPRVWLGNFEVEQVWARGATSLPRVSSREGTATVARLDEFALWMATSADVVLLTDDTDPEFASYVSSITGQAPRIISLGAAASHGLVSEAALDAAREGRLPDFPAGAGVVAHGYSRVEREFAAAAALGWVAPDVDDVIAVNSKIYSRNLADELGIRQPRGTTCERLDDWDRARRFARALLDDGPVVVKEEYGVSGKGMAVADSPARLDRIARRIVQTAERNHGRVGFIVERWVDKDRDFNYQFTIDRDGRVALDFVKQILTRTGVHLGHLIPAELAPTQLDEIRRTAQRVGARLYRDGYWGVVGIDALTETDGTLHPLIEINARCNMSTYQLPAQEAFGDSVDDAAFARHYEIRADRPIPFARVRDALGDLLLVPGRTRGMVVLNHATLNAAGAVAAEGEPWIGRLYGLLRDRDRTALDELDAEVASALAPLSIGAISAGSTA